MIVLGVSETHCATAAILRDGEIVGCASEERFSRLTNDSGYPKRAIDALLAEFRLAPSNIDVVALAGRTAYAREWMNRLQTDEAYVRSYYGVGLDASGQTPRRRCRKLAAINKLGFGEGSHGERRLSDGERLDSVALHLGLGRDRVVTLDHHTCHAAAAYFGAPFSGEPTLVLTNDNSGDGLCATASSGCGLALERREATPRAFPTNPKRRDEIVAAIHPADGTARAQILDETWNPDYYSVIREFERRTGIGAVLNTSFNLHGEPLVCSAADAVDMFERSGLRHLVLDRWLISKK